MIPMLPLLADVKTGDLRDGIPIIVQEPVELLLMMGVMLLFALPVYLAVRRRTFRRWRRG